jgi:ribonuclease HII
MKDKSVKEIKELVDSLPTNNYLEYIEILRNDERKSVQNIAVKMAKKLDAIRKENERLETINIFENEG